jgi:CheY-like chemotaxis protein
VEDNSFLAELTAELLHLADQSMQLCEAITLAEDLHPAIICLPEQDAVLCDGMLPVSPESRFIVEDWDVIRNEAHRRGIHFVLYSGLVHALDSARATHTPALAKPAAIEEIYAALTHHQLPVHSKADGESALVAENIRLAGGNHAPEPLKITARNRKWKSTSPQNRSAASTIIKPSILAALWGAKKFRAPTFGNAPAGSY